MATATKVLVDNNGGSGDFSVLYTQMATGDFPQIPDGDPVSNFSAIVFEIIAMGSAGILASGHEDREDIIEVIMKRLGVRKSVLVARDLAVQAIYTGIVSTVAVIAMWAAAYKETLGLGVFALFAFLNQVQAITRQLVIANALPRQIGVPVHVLYLFF